MKNNILLMTIAIMIIAITSHAQVKPKSSVKQKENVSKTTKNCNVEISGSYTDTEASNEQVMGTGVIVFTKLSEGNYKAYIQQIYSTQGESYPKQKFTKLFIDSNGIITFETKWFTDDDGDISKFKLVKAKGRISKKNITFKLDLPDSGEFSFNKHPFSK